MNLKTRTCTALTLAVFASSVLAGCAADEMPPTVLQTVPANGDSDVDPSLSELSVTFSEPMQDGNWSWVYESKESFPTMLGHPRFEEGLTTNVLPVRLEPDKEYVVWVNSAEFTNFKDAAGNSAPPFRFTFSTGPATE